MSLVLGVSLLAAACSSAAEPEAKAPADTGEPTTSEPDSGDDQELSSQTTLVDLLDRIPLAAYEASLDNSGSVEVHLTDIAAAAELVGLDRPDRSDIEAGVDWFLELTSYDTDESGYIVMPPRFPQLAAARQSEQIAAELGFSVLGIDRSATLFDLPIFFAAAEGEALELSPNLIQLDGGVVTAGEGEDLIQNVETRTAARPLGRPLRMAADGDAVLASFSTPLVEAGLAGGPSMLEVESFALIASALDSAGSLSALIVQSDFQNLDYLLDDDPELRRGVSEPFTTVGVGSILLDGRGAAVVAYVFGDEAAASASVSELERLWSSAPISGSEATIANFFELKSVEQQGRVVLVVASVAEGQLTTTAVSFLFRREVVFTSS